MAIERVSADYLSDLFGSDPFYSSLLEINRRTREDGKEHAFTIYKPCEKDSCGSETRDGKPVIYDGTEKTCALKRNFIAYTEGADVHFMYIVNEAHTHPGGSFCPSIGDLECYSDIRLEYQNEYGLNPKPVSVISVPLSHGNVFLLLFQEKSHATLTKEDCMNMKKYMDNNHRIYKKLRWLRSRIPCSDGLWNKFFQNYIIRISGYSIPRTDMLLEKTGKYNALFALFNEQNGLKIPVSLLKNFEYEMDTSDLRLPGEESQRRK